jgi:hypothetical protein
MKGGGGVWGVLSWLNHWTRRAGTRPALAALVSIVKNIIFLTVHLFTLFVHLATWAGRRAGSPVSGSLATTLDGKDRDNSVGETRPHREAEQT